MILTVTLNMALDHLIFLPQLNKNAINRIERSYTVPGGKGVNVAANLAVLGQDVIATGFVGRRGTRFIEQALQNLGVTTNFVYIDEDVRTDTYIVEEGLGNKILLIEKGMTIKDRFLITFLDNYKRVLNNVETVVIAGSLPAGVYFDFVGTLADVAFFEDKQVIVNCKENILNKIIGKRKFKIIKPDVRDTDKLFDLEYKNLENRLTLAKKVLGKGAEIFILNYADFAYFIANKQRCFQVLVKKNSVKNIKSMIGLEDGFLAGFIDGLGQACALEEAAKKGLATAMANAQTINNYIDNREAMEEQLKRVVVENI
jgi:tagatose 6-phosphate kinase